MLYGAHNVVFLLMLLQVMSAEIGYERGQSAGDDGDSQEADEAAESVAQGQATQAKSMGAAIKDFLTTPQVSPPLYLP